MDSFFWAICPRKWFFFLKRLHTERQNTFIPLERLAGSGSNSPPRLKFYFRERATVKFPWVSRGGRWLEHDIWSMASWKLKATPSFNELSTYVYCFLLLSVCFLNSFLQQLCDGLKNCRHFDEKENMGETSMHSTCLMFNFLSSWTVFVTVWIQSLIVK